MNISPTSSSYGDDTYYQQHQQRNQDNRPQLQPPVPPPQRQQQQQQQSHITNKDNFSSRPGYENQQRTFRNFPHGEQHHRVTRYDQPDEKGYYKDRNISSDSKNYANWPPSYGRAEGSLSQRNYSDRPRSRFDQGNNSNDTTNLMHSKSFQPPSNDSSYQPNFSPSGFVSERFPNTNVPPPPLHMPPQSPQIRSQPPPSREKAAFHSGANYIPQGDNVATREYSANLTMPPLFPRLDTSCPPPPPSLPPPPLPPPPPPSVMHHTSPAPVPVGTSPLPPQYLKPCPVPFYPESGSSIPLNSTSVPPPLAACYISRPPPPLTDTLNTANQLYKDTTTTTNNNNNFNAASNSGFADVTLTTSNFSVPPPLTPVYGSRVLPKTDSSVDSQHSEIDDALQQQRQQDKEWIKQKFSSKLHDQPSKKSPTITIWESQNLIRKILVHAGQLHKLKKTLENIHEVATEEEWLAEIRKIDAVKVTLEELRQKIIDKDLIEELEKKVKARQKKRARLKRLRKKKYEDRELAMSYRKERHRVLDDWRESISQKERQIKQEKEMKVAVDSVLGEVRKKKSDVAKMLELIGNLSKLRKIRKENVAKKGLYTLFHCDQKFEEDISGLQRMLNNQMDIYEAEQRTLMVMLECEQEETKERERVKSHKVKKEIEKREKKRELQLLFGKDIIDPADPCYPFMKYYTQAIDNWESFVQIRRDWDCYLAPETAPGASRIPDTWVLPSEPSSSVWARFLES